MELSHAQQLQALRLPSVKQVLIPGPETTAFLTVVPVFVKSKKGSKFVETYAFMDPGSSATFCTHALARQLNLEGRRTQLELKSLSLLIMWKAIC